MSDQSPVCKEVVFDYLVKGNGLRYCRSKLAQRLHCASKDLELPLGELASCGRIKVVVEGKNRMYWVQTQMERDAEMKVRHAYTFKPLIGYAEKLRAAIDGGR